MTCCFPSVETHCRLVADAILFCHDPEDSMGVHVLSIRFERYRVVQDILTTVAVRKGALFVPAID